MHIIRILIYFLLVAFTFNKVSAGTDGNTLYSNPPGVEIFNSDDKKIGTTPFDLHSLPPNTTTIFLRMKGYEDVTLKFKIVNNSTFSFEEGFLLCDTCKLETSGYMYAFQPVNPVVKLRRVITRVDNPININLDEVTLDPNLVNVGRINSTDYTVRDNSYNMSFGYVGDVVYYIKDVMKEYYLSPYRLSKVTDSEISLGRPRVIITPVIKNLFVKYYGGTKEGMKGEGKMEVQWKFSYISKPEKFIDSLTTRTSYFRIGQPGERVIEPLMKEASLDLMSIDTLYEYLSRLDRKYILLSKGDTIKINSGEKKHFETTKEGLKNARNAVVTIKRKNIFGSGFIISPDGYIITNYHVVGNEKSVDVKLGESALVKGKVVKSNPDFDLALVKIDVADLAYINFGSSESLESGDEVYAIGTPLDESLGQTITRGIVSGIRTFDGLQFIQTDVSINHGNSGGPLINDKAEVIGMTTLKVSGENIDRIGFCLPSDVILEMLNIKF